MNKLTKVPLWVTAALLAYMPFHVFLSQWLSTYTGGLELWKAGKDIVVLLIGPPALYVAYKQGLLSRPLMRWLVGLTVVFGAQHMLFLAFAPGLDRQTALEASVYNNRFLWYSLLGITAGAVATKKEVGTITKLVLIVSSVVAMLGVAQYFLPKDLLTHFGYSVARGVKPAFYIDDKPDFPRIMATIRDPNSLGAFLVLPITLLTLVFIKSKKKLLFAGLLMLHVLALFLTFSRGAWLGTAISLGLVVALNYRVKLKGSLFNYRFLVIGLLIVVVGASLLLKNTYAFQNLVFHSDKSTIQADPNELRVSLQKQAVQGIIDKPIGHGPGTAGVVAIRNVNGGILTENYYLQIAYEVGVVGLIVFCLVLVLVGKGLYMQRNDSSQRLLRYALLASLGGYLFIALLIHLWSNEAVAAQWWLLSGLVLGQTYAKKTKALVS